MCEILGISLITSCRPEKYLKEFLCNGKNYDYGWGLGLYPDNSAQVIKESTYANRLSWDRFLKYCKELNSKIFVGQLRNSTIGPRSRKNNHPFHRELNGKEYIFAHNGTVFNFKNLEIGQSTPLGDTDTEHIFCHLLDCIKKLNIYNWQIKDFQWLAHKMRELNQLGTLNCVFSDGTYLFAYKSTKIENNLYFNPINIDFKATLDDFWPEIKTLVTSKIGMIISTRQLTKKPCYQLKRGELIAIKDGKVVYSNFMDYPK
jgi:predicted glutamine amidotransferase